MRTIVFLVGHAVSEQQASRVLIGRTPGIGLGAQGQRQAARLAERFAGESITAIETSPQERAYATAAIIAAQIGLGVTSVPALDEIDLGEWTGHSPKELEHDLRWRRWNLSRGSATCPGGESMAAVQARAVDHIARARHKGGRVVMVTHPELIRAVLLYCLDMPLDDFRRIEILPSSVNTLVFDDYVPEVAVVNGRVAVAA